jgi:soluble lytic murein transglycosylase-like protein
MPRFPDVGSLGERPRISPQAAASTIDPSALGRARVNLGDTMMQIAADFQKQVAHETEKLDTAGAEEAFNKYRETQAQLTFGEQGYTRQRGGDAIGAQFIDRYMGRLKDSARQIESTLPNDRQRDIFQRRAGLTDAQFASSLLQHSGREADARSAQVFQGVVDVETTNAALNWSDPPALGTGRARMDYAIGKEAERRGLPADAAFALSTEKLQRFHENVVTGALAAGNLDYAKSYIDRNRREISAGDLLKYRDLVNKDAELGQAMGAADAAVREAAPQLAPTDRTRLSSLVERTESGGNAAAVSPKGALGMMQVMPATAREVHDRLYPGQPFDVKRLTSSAPADVAYNRALGNAYLDEQLRKYSGDPALALAAYNAGPGAVDAAVKKSRAGADLPAAGLIDRGNIDLTKRPTVKNADGTVSTVRSMSFEVDGNQVLVPTVSDNGRIMSDQEAMEAYRRTGKHLGIFDTPANATAYAKALSKAQDAAYTGGGRPGDWLSYLPAETQAYVPKILGQFQSGMGQPPRPTLIEVQDAAVARLPANAPARVVKQTRDEAERRFGDIEKSLKQREEQSFSDVYRIVDAAGGDLSRVPITLRSALPGEKWQGVEEYAKKKREGGFVSTDPAIFTQLRQQAFSNPSEFANANLLAFRHRLNAGDFEQMVKLQESVKKGEVKPGALMLSNQFDSLVKDALVARGEDVGQPAGKQKLAQASLSLYNWIKDYQTSNAGKMPNETEVQDRVGRMLLKRDTGTFSANRYAFETDARGEKAPISINDARKTTINDVPPELRTRIEGALSQGGRAYGKEFGDKHIIATWIASRASPQDVAEADRKEVMKRLSARGITTPTLPQFQQGLAEYLVNEPAGMRRAPTAPRERAPGPWVGMIRGPQ